MALRRRPPRRRGSERPARTRASRGPPRGPRCPSRPLRRKPARSSPAKREQEPYSSLDSCPQSRTSH
eukprot:2394644-Prymnesium_polylepis.1